MPAYSEPGIYNVLDPPFNLSSSSAPGVALSNAIGLQLAVFHLGDDLGQDAVGGRRQADLLALARDHAVEELDLRAPALHHVLAHRGTVLAASLRGPIHVIESALAGAHIGTMPFKVLDQLFSHPLTDKGLDQFLKDYHKAFDTEPAVR